VLLDYLDPAGDLIAGERLDELRMIVPEMALNQSGHLVVCLTPCDEAAFALICPDISLSRRLSEPVLSHISPATLERG
jgi:hypothetical protein